MALIFSKNDYSRRKSKTRHGNLPDLEFDISVPETTQEIWFRKSANKLRDIKSQSFEYLRLLNRIT